MKYFKYHNTNCFFVESTTSGKLLVVDAGWPCTLFEYQRCMKQIGCEYRNIEMAIVTHFHMDHAGLVSEFINGGITCFVFENQIEAIDEMERIIEKNKEYSNYRKIVKEKLHLIDIVQFNKILLEKGYNGIIISTKGHSPDSITYITNNNEAIIGDLYPIEQVMENDSISIESWSRIKESNARIIYPSHANVFRI